MSYQSNVLSQVIQQISKLEFQSIVNRYQGDHRIRKLDCWTWFGSLIFGQLTGRNSVRSISKSFQPTRKGLKSLGFANVCKSTLADANEKRPVQILEDVSQLILKKAQTFSPKSRFRFNGKVIAVDSSLIPLCLSLCPWAAHRSKSGGVKLHSGLDLAGGLPLFSIITTGKINDAHAIKGMKFESGSTFVLDRGYFDFSLLKEIDSRDAYFVTRLKSNCKYKVKKCRKTNRKTGVMCDQTVELTGFAGYAKYGDDLRKISYKDPETGKRYVYLTNRFDLAPKTIAQIYKRRWDIELFFKNLKGNLKIKKFLGTTENSVRAQIFAAIITHMLISIIKWKAKLNWSIPQLMATIGAMIFVRLNIYDVLEGPPPKSKDVSASLQLPLFVF